MRQSPVAAIRAFFGTVFATPGPLWALKSRWVRSRVACTRLLAGLCAISLLTTPMPAAPQERAQRGPFRSYVDLIQFQVGVSTPSGEPAAGLEADDFRVLVNGAERAISSVYEVNLRPASRDIAGTMPEGVSTPLPAAAWRQFVLFFDAAFSTPRGVRAAQLAALEFLDEHALAQDLVSVITYNVVEGIKVRLPLTNDHRQVRGAVQELGLTQATKIVDRAGFLTQMIIGDMAVSAAPPGVSGEVALAEVLQDYMTMILRAEERQYRDYAARYAEQIGELGELLRVIRGRKHLILFSTGIEDSAVTGQDLDELALAADLYQQGRLNQVDPEARFGGAEVRGAIMDAIESLKLADTVMHVVDTEGLGGGQHRGLSGGASPSTLNSSESGRDSLIVWADGTGGTVVWEDSDIGGALGELERSLRQFYVLSLPRYADDPEVLDVDVQVVAPGVEVTHAPSRFAPPPRYAAMSEMQRQAHLAEFVSKGIVSGDLQFDVAVYTYRGTRRIARVPVVVEVPWPQLEELASARDEGPVALELLAYVVAEDGTMVDLTNRVLSIDVARLRASSAAGQPFRVYDLLWSWPGRHEVRVLLRESQAGRLSSVVHDLQVPELDSDTMLLTRPALIDADHPGLVLRSFDEMAPPQHKMGGPVSYPFELGNRAVTPDVRGPVVAGGTCQVFVQVYNLARHPFTGGTQSGFDMHLVDAGWRTHALEQVEILEQAADNATGTLAAVLGGRVPTSVPPGEYRLAITVRDRIDGAEQVQWSPVVITASTQRH